MFNLFELMQSSQNGAAVEALARQFGLSQAQANKAVDALLPAFMLGMQRMAQPGAGGFVPLGAEGAAAMQAFSQAAMIQGPAMVASLFGSQDLARQVAQQAAAASGVSQGTLEKMMPEMAAMMAAGAARSFTEQGVAWMKAFQGAATPASSSAPGRSSPPQEPASGAGQGAAAPNPFDPAGMAQFFGRMMGVEPPKDEAPAPPPPTASELGMGAMSQFLETGREVQEQHLRNLQELFARLSAQPDKPA